MYQRAVRSSRRRGSKREGGGTDLNNTVSDGLLDLSLGGTGSSVEDEEERSLGSGLDLLGDESLVLSEDLGLELNVSGLVDTVN